MQQLVERAGYYLRRGEYGSAIEACHEILAIDPHHEYACYVAGLSGLHLKDFELTRAMAGTLMGNDPESPWGHELLGYHAYESKQFDRAEQHFRDALRYAPDEASYYGTLGLFLAERGRMEEGITVARKGLKQWPEDTGLLIILQQLYRRNDEPDLAEEMERRAAELNPEDADFQLEAGLRLLEAGKKSDARGRFLESLRINPMEGDHYEAIAHEKVRTHPFFRNGLFLTAELDKLVVILLTPLIWWLLSLAFRPFIYLCWAALTVIIIAYVYRGLFFICRWWVLRNLRRGRV